VTLPGKGPTQSADGDANLWDDAWDDLAAGDEARLIARYLRAIAESQGALSGPLPETTAGEEGQEEPRYHYFEGMTATAGVSKLAEWGYAADTVAIRNTDGPLRVAFKDPDTNDRAFIPVDADETPWVLSGVYGVKARAIWAESGDGTDVSLDVLVTRAGGN
jgi:hypothetical protein